MENPNTDALTALHQLALEAPKPLHDWLLELTDLCWTYMLEQTARHIEHQWQDQIMLFYQTAIQNRYPFNDTALTEVKLNNFSRFMGYQGDLALFFQKYLKPFVVENKSTLEWRIVENHKLPLKESLLDQFSRIKKIQLAFFPNGDNKLYVPFILKPLSLDPKIKEVILNINGQTLNYQKNNLATSQLIAWPGNAPVANTSLSIVKSNYQALNQHISGEWGWFKLINHSIEAIYSKKKIGVNLNLEGYSAKYILLTQGVINPFSNLDLTSFQLAEKIQT